MKHLEAQNAGTILLSSYDLERVLSAIKPANVNIPGGIFDDNPGDYITFLEESIENGNGVCNVE